MNREHFILITGVFILIGVMFSIAQGNGPFHYPTKFHQLTKDSDAYQNITNSPQAKAAGEWLMLGGVLLFASFFAILPNLIEAARDHRGDTHEEGTSNDDTNRDH